MKIIIRTNYPQSPASRQSGVSLFIALIVLVAMTLAAISLIRSVDTSTVIAGNLAFKQSTTSSADIALNNASDWIFASTSTALESNSAANGYYATSTGLDLMADATWAAGVSKLASGAGIASGVDSSGNEIRYVVQRMCQGAGPKNAATCLFGGANQPTGSMTGGTYDDPVGAASDASPLYRITARVSGPRNTVSYIQGFLY